MVEVGDPDGRDPAIGEVAAEFTAAGDLAGWTGCNSFAARYSARGEDLQLAGLGWTEAGCPSQAMFWQEQRIQHSLATIEGFAIDEDRLLIESEGGWLLVFELVGRR